MDQLHAIEQTILGAIDNARVTSRSDGTAKKDAEKAQAHAAALRRTPGSGQRKATEKSRRFDARRKGGWQARDRAHA